MTPLSSNNATDENWHRPWCRGRCSTFSTGVLPLPWRGCSGSLLRRSSIDRYPPVGQATQAHRLPNSQRLRSVGDDVIHRDEVLVAEAVESRANGDPHSAPREGSVFVTMAGTSTTAPLRDHTPELSSARRQQESDKRRSHHLMRSERTWHEVKCALCR